MIKEYRYKSTIFNKILPIIWILLATTGFVYSTIYVILSKSYASSWIYGIMYAFFIYIFIYFFKVYYLRKPLLSLLPTKILYQSPSGIKEISYEDISKIDVKHGKFSSTITIFSSNSAPIRVPISRLDDTEDNIIKYVTSMYDVNKKAEE